MLTVSSISFAQMIISFSTAKVTSSIWICNLDETWFTSGQDFYGTRIRIIFTELWKRSVVLCACFRYFYCNSVLAAVFTEVESRLPVVSFCCVRGLAFFNSAKFVMAFKAFPLGTKLFWLEDCASIDMAIFRRWSIGFIPPTHRIVCSNRQVVLFHDALRAHTTPYIIYHVYEKKIAGIASTSHTSDRLRLLDVSCFIPFKNYGNAAIDVGSKNPQQLS